MGTAPVIVIDLVQRRCVSCDLPLGQHTLERYELITKKGQDTNLIMVLECKR